MQRRKFLLTGFGAAISATLIYKVRSRSSGAISQAAQTVKQSESILSAPLFRFAAIADTGWGGSDQYAVAQAMFQRYQEQPFSRVLMAGDNLYPDGNIHLVKPNFEDPYAALLERGVKFYAVLGNHDIIHSHNGVDQINYLSFNMSGRYYAFQQRVNNRAVVDFFAIETNESAPWSPQLAGLDHALSVSTAPWKIVFGHHPLYSSGRHGGDPELVAKLSPLFEKHTVSLYLCGHDHCYERFAPINGTTYIVNGGGGAPLYAVGKSPQTAFSSSQHSFMTFDVHEDRIVANAISTDGRVFDQAVIGAS
jgi:3',5'-cyclic AMP phosphodiesterase CpdA